MIRLPSGLHLVLASRSPRRRDLLRSVGLDPIIRPPDVDETPRDGEDPVDYVRRLSSAKADEVAGADELVIAADTTIDLDGTILEKPVGRDDAARMLRALSGRAHRCHTGVTVRLGGHARTLVVTTTVTFVEIADKALEWYLDTGDADDKAGAYGIQGPAGAFVERVDGSVTNVVGLPLAETVQMVRTALGAGTGRPTPLG